MKILVLASNHNLEHKLGCTPSWWQLMKAFRELGHEVISIPYMGDPIETLWWDTYPNPCTAESKLMYRVTNSDKDLVSGKAGISKKVSRFFIENHIRPKWRDHLFDVLHEEEDIDLVFMLNIPVNHFTNIPTEIREEFGVEVAFYDGDMPTVLPQYAVDRGFRFNYYEGADLSEYDAFFSNSKGAIKDLKKMGAKNTHALYWAVDPDLFKPVDIEEDYDVSFFGYGNEMREEWMTNLITEPSKALPDVRFVIGGGGFTIPLGNAEPVGDVPYSKYAEFVCRSKINLNTTRWSHTQVYASATSRPFELAAFGACTVSQPYNGIEEWFELGDEMIVVETENEAISVYDQLLEDDEERARIGRNAREAVLERHTFRHRAEQVLRNV